MKDRMKYLVWGTGEATKKLLREGYLDLQNIVGFVESNPKGHMFSERPIYQPFEVNGLDEWEIIIVAVSREKALREICKTARQLGIEKKLIFLHNRIVERTISTLHEQDDELLDKVHPGLRELADRHFKTQYSLQLTSKCGRDFIDENRLVGNKLPFETGCYMNDYTRYRTFELIAEEIIAKDLPGNTAEVGVFRGEFSRLIHAKMPDKVHYMYDTFSGFDEQEFEKEVAAGNLGDFFLGLFKNTSVETVMKGMVRPENCVIRQGYFPQTVQAEDERQMFCFASLDVDLEESSYQALQFFYPRIVEGGYIFLHDYNNGGFFGIKQAVSRFMNDSKEKLKIVPLSDGGGTLIICK